MSCKLNRLAYEKLIEEDLAELFKLPRTLERDHIEGVLKESIRCHYDETWNADYEQKPQWISVKKSLPSVKNGYIDELVQVCVKNKNMECGIFIFDVANFDGEVWSKRYNSWEDIIYWKPFQEPDKE